jgi:hypothetical protein
MSETNGKHGKELDAALGQVPMLMAELMKEFIENKDLNSRVQIRSRMKALLDFAFVDTVWPTNPIMKKGEGPNPARDMAMMDSGSMMQSPAIAVTPPVFAGAGVQAVPGAERLEDNSI